MADARAQYTAWQRNAARDPARYNPNYIMGGGGLYNAMYFPGSNIFAYTGKTNPWDWSNKLVKMQSINQNTGGYDATEDFDVTNTTGISTPKYATPAEVMGKHEFNIFSNWDGMQKTLKNYTPLRRQWDDLQNDYFKAGSDPMKLGWIIGQSAFLFNRMGMSSKWIPQYKTPSIIQQPHQASPEAYK